MPDLDKKGISMNFIRKNASEFQQGYTGFYLKPAVCPHCGTGTDAVSTAREVFAFSANANLLLSSVKCTSCSKTFFFANLRESGNTDAEVVCIYPSLAKEYTNDTLEKISPRFIAMYNQSLRSEKAGDTELAALGYCSALETLVKDYALSELGKPAEEVVTKQLFDAISDYLLQKDLINTPDLRRILGDNYTHYEEKYPEQDLLILKGYMEIFLKQIEMQYLIKHMGAI
jgi:hypothetical protein